MNAIRIGTAPVSFGFYGDKGRGQPEVGRLVLAAMAAGGYEGTELAAAGLFGTLDDIADNFRNAGMSAIGAYTGLHLSRPELDSSDLERLHASCRELRASGAELSILADEGSPLLLEHPARDPGDRSMALDDTGWHHLTENLTRAMDIASGYGLATSFHPHISTFVESAWEIERMLESTDISLTVDTGHLLLAGADPTECIKSWGERINHVHYKDVDVRVLEDARREGRKDFDVWWADVSVPLGAGGVDFPAVTDALVEGSYQGWIVIEQDTELADLSDLEVLGVEQGRNRDWLNHLLERVGVASPDAAANGHDTGSGE